jgi:D-3-phosphoglycerate dehydrogenase
MMPVCLIAEPIHPAGAERLKGAGIAVRNASCADLASIPRELTDVDAIVVRGALPAAAIDAAPRLAVIANHGTGTDAVDVAHAHALGIPVAYTPDANVRAVAEHAVMLMLAVARRTVAADAATRRAYVRFKYEQPMVSLDGKTLGIAGFGRTGQRVCEIARGLGMQVQVWSPRSDPAVIAAQGARAVPELRQLLEAADVVTLHRPLRPDTRHTLDRTALAWLRPGAIVVNTSRGGLIDEEALADALRERRLFGAGLDVLAAEPLPPDSPLAALDNVVLTPHVAGSTQEALRGTAVLCAEQIIDVLAGRRPASLVDPSMWARRRASALQE